MPIETKTLGMLVDELCTTSQKCFRLQDAIMSAPDGEAGKMAKELQGLNRRRTELISAIDAQVGQTHGPTRKTY